MGISWASLFSFIEWLKTLLSLVKRLLMRRPPPESQSSASQSASGTNPINIYVEGNSEVTIHIHYTQGGGQTSLPSVNWQPREPEDDTEDQIEGDSL